MEEELLNGLKDFRDYCKNNENCGRCKRKHYALWKFCCEYLTNTNRNINPEDWRFDEDDDDYEDVQQVIHAHFEPYSLDFWKCSKCGEMIFSQTEADRNLHHRFCGKCGAKMDEEPEADES